MADALPLEIADELRTAVAGASDSETYFVVAYNGDDGWPHISNRGTLQVWGPQQLAIWVRKRGDGLAVAMADRPQISLYQYDATKPQVYWLFGRGQVSHDKEIDARVYASAPEREQAQDPDREGVALIIELERIQAGGVHNYLMERSAT